MVHYLYMYSKGFNGYFIISGLVKSMFYIKKQGGCLNDMHLTKKCQCVGILLIQEKCGSDCLAVKGYSLKSQRQDFYRQYSFSG